MDSGGNTDLAKVAAWLSQKLGNDLCVLIVAIRRAQKAFQETMCKHLILDQTDLDQLQLTGYAADAAEEIAAIAASDTDESATAGEALSLLFRLQRSVK